MTINGNDTPTWQNRVRGTSLSGALTEADRGTAKADFYEMIESLNNAMADRRDNDVKEVQYQLRNFLSSELPKLPRRAANELMKALTTRYYTKLGTLDLNQECAQRWDGVMKLRIISDELHSTVSKGGTTENLAIESRLRNTLNEAGLTSTLACQITKETKAKAIQDSRKTV